MPVAIEICQDVNEDAAWGNYNAPQHKIRLREEMPFASKAIEVVLHELLHAIFHCADLNDKDEEERTVAAFATWMTMVLMDNPALVSWLAKAARPS